MTKPQAGAERPKDSTFKRIVLSWIVVVFVAYIAMAGFQKFVIFPMESKLLPLYSQYASLVYLPHAVRVLATAIYGPKTFLVLLPAILFETYLLYPPASGQLSLTILTLAVIGAACAPIACIILMRISSMVISGFDTSDAIFHWRYIFVGGILASAINSIGLTVFFFDVTDISAASLAMLRFFIGDIVGLFVGLVILTWVFRILRKTREAKI